MTFPLGKPILVMLILAVLTGTIVAFQQPTPSSDLTIWSFSSSRNYLNSTPSQATPPLLQKFEEMTNTTIGIRRMSTRALDTRLLSLFMQTGTHVQTPDLVEIEIGSVGKFFRPPVDQIGLLPLDDFLAHTEPRIQLLPSRLAPWSKDGHLFGLPQDVHPVTLTYRKDLFDQAGVDPATAHTWPQLRQACLIFQNYWRAHGEPARQAMELQTASSDYLEVMLLQQRLNLLGPNNEIHLADPIVAKTLAFYASLVAGPHLVAAPSSAGDTQWTGDVRRGDLCMLFTPDWRAAGLKKMAPDLAGKLAMIPLPLFDLADAPTATWGGTMLSIPRGCTDPALAWKLAVFLTTSPEARQAAQASGLDIIPPLPQVWSDPMFHKPDPYYFANQSIDDLYVKLARELPPRYVTPFSSIASTELSDALSKAVAWEREFGDDGLEARCQQWLATAANDLSRRIQFGTFGN